MVVGVITRESIHKVGFPGIILLLDNNSILQSVYRALCTPMHALHNSYIHMPSKNILEGWRVGWVRVVGEEGGGEACMLARSHDFN